MRRITSVIRAAVSPLARRLHGGDQGATAVEYALIISLIAVVLIGVLTLLGQNLVTEFNNIIAAFG